jgi:hypothetical protein
MAIYGIKIEKSFGGRSNRMKWSNQWWFQPTLPGLTLAALNPVVDAIVNAERAAHLDSVQFLRAFVRQKADNYLNAPPNAFKTRLLDVAGQRVANSPALPIEIALALGKETEEGRIGTMLLRGCLMQSDVIAGSDNTYRLADPTTFTGGGEGLDTLAERLAPALLLGTFVIPNAAGLTVQTAREVISHTVQGVVVVQSTRNRRSIKSSELDVAQRQINSKSAEIASLVRRAAGDVLSGNFLALALDLASAAWSIYTSLSVSDRARIKMPSRILAFKASP